MQFLSYDLTVVSPDKVNELLQELNYYSSLSVAIMHVIITLAHLHITVCVDEQW